jgi:uncharacterized membrane protein
MTGGDDESLDARHERHAYDRMNTLSDGVFAIAITLLAFDIRPPEGWRGDVPALIAGLSPMLSAYATSFVVIATYWFLHRRYVAMLARMDGGATALNLLFLALVALLPADTRIANLSEGVLAVLAVYASLVIAIGFSLALLWGYAAFVGRLVMRDVTLRERWGMLLGPIVLPPLLLFVIIGTHLPEAVVPVAIGVLFVAGWVVTQRFVRPAARKAETPDASRTEPS